jgi:nitrate/TMAO reductase-like tetraheme cytochrome c subunit
MRQKLPTSFYNPVTLTGTAIAIVSFGLIVFLFILELLSSEQKPYMGIIAFVILPAFLILGLILIVYGIFREHHRRKLGIKDERKFPVINLNDPKQRTAITLFIGGTILLLIFTAFGSYQAYEYTDSDEFCGTMCHTVMEPEFTAYQFSPHARVGCVQCHIGSGAEWYVRSKFSGAYQVYSVLFNKYSKPIPTPIENLRPAQETCEQCHWPEHFYSEKKHEYTYYASDEENSKWKLTLLMKVGGGYEESGITTGIHWHMNIANEINYVAMDEGRLLIPWVKVKSKDGRETIYRRRDSSLKDEDITPDMIRRMDCIDCHNRPSHIFNPPMRSVNHLMELNRIDPELPFIKSISVQALEKPYSTKDIALDSIETIIYDFYKVNYPYIYSDKYESIVRSIEEVQKIYSRNYFPYMRASWKYFPNQIGHLFAPGCFRCHDGNHFSDDGIVISHECNVCHTILAQEFENKEIEFSLEGIEYKHPVDIGTSWKEIGCPSCHRAK